MYFENRGRGLLKVEKPRGRIIDKYIVISARVFSKNRKVNE